MACGRIHNPPGLEGISAAGECVEQRRAVVDQICVRFAMVESGSISRTSPGSGGSIGGVVAGVRSGILETRVRGAWYRVSVTLESDYISVSLDETCEPVDHSTTLNGTLG